MAEDMRQKLSEAQRKYLTGCMKTVIDDAFNGTGVTMSEWMASGNGGNALLNFINAIKPDIPGLSDGELSACVQMEAVDAYVAFNERVLLNGAECEFNAKARAAAKAAVPGKLDAIRAEAMNAMPAELAKTDKPMQLGHDVQQGSGAEALNSALTGEIRDEGNEKGMGTGGEKPPNGSVDPNTDPAKNGKKDAQPEIGDGQPEAGTGDGQPEAGTGDGQPETGAGDGQPETGAGDGQPETGAGDVQLETGTGSDQLTQKKKNKTTEEAMEAMAAASMAMATSVSAMAAANLAAANGKQNEGTSGGQNAGRDGSGTPQPNNAGAGIAANGEQPPGSGKPEDGASAESVNGSGKQSGKDGESKQHRESAEHAKQMSMLDQMMQEGRIPKERYDQLRMVVDLMEVMREANPTYRALGNTVDFLESDKSRSMKKLRKDAMAATERHKKLENMLRAEFDSAMGGAASDILKRDVLAGGEKKKQNPLSKFREAIPSRKHGTEPDAAEKEPNAQDPETKSRFKVPVPVHKFITTLPVLGAACKDAFHKIKDKLGSAIEENKAKRAKGQGKTHEEAVTEFAEAMAHEPDAVAPTEPGLKKILNNLTDYIDSLQAVKADIAKHAEAPSEQKQPARVEEQQAAPAEQASVQETVQAEPAAEERQEPAEQQPVQAEEQEEAQQDLAAEEQPEGFEYLEDEGYGDIPMAPEPEEDEFPAGGVVLTTEYRSGEPAPDPMAAAKAVEELEKMSLSGSQAAEKAAEAVDAATDDMARRNQEIIEKGLSDMKAPHKPEPRRGSSLDAMNKLTAETDENEAGRSDDGYQK